VPLRRAHAGAREFSCQALQSVTQRTQAATYALARDARGTTQLTRQDRVFSLVENATSHRKLLIVGELVQRGERNAAGQLVDPRDRLVVKLETLDMKPAASTVADLTALKAVGKHVARDPVQPSTRLATRDVKRAPGRERFCERLSGQIGCEIRPVAPETSKKDSEHEILMASVKRAERIGVPTEQLGIGPVLPTNIHLQRSSGSASPL